MKSWHGWVRNFGRGGALAVTLAGMGFTGAGFAQNPSANWSLEDQRISHVVMPQVRGFALRGEADPIEVEAVNARVEIVGQVATTNLEVIVTNPHSRIAEAVLLLPVPEGAVVDRFVFEGPADEPTARLLPKEEARATYDAIVARIKDPALLEFAGCRLIRSSVFPVPAGGTQRIRVGYHHLLEADGARVDYQLPRSESLTNRVPWNITVEVRASAPISMVYSPSHELDTRQRSPQRIVVQAKKPTGITDPGPFLLSYLLEREGVTASIMACPDPDTVESGGGGYFLLMAGLPASIDDVEGEIKREVILVLDRSGSMGSGKLEQAKTAALQILEGLTPGEAFNILDYSDQVNRFAPGPVIKNETTIAEARRYLRGIHSQGGTNIHDALALALAQEHDETMLGMVLFLTDGLPTVGNTSEVAIREMAEKVNGHERRLFTLGVGLDVNVPLLDNLAETSRATSTYVLPGEDVEVKVGEVFEDLYGPVLADLELEVLDAEGETTTRMVRDMLPSTLPDLFEGDQLVLLGRYLEAAPVRFRLRGNFLGTTRAFTFRSDFARANSRNALVPRLWASRKIAYLIDEIRQAGAEAPVVASFMNSTPPVDPRQKELSDEILRLSARFGVLSEYTAFLALEGTDLEDWGSNGSTAIANLNRRAVQSRTGIGALNQNANISAQKAFSNNPNNVFFDENNIIVPPLLSVQQVYDRAFFQRGNRWIDSRLIEETAESEPTETIDFGSEAHRALVDRLAAEGRSGMISLDGEILVEIDGRAVLVRNSPVIEAEK